MPTLRESLQRKLTEVVLADLPTPVPSPVLEKLGQDLATTVSTWLHDIYQDHSVEVSVSGDAATHVARPSFEWLCESMRA